MNRSQRSAARSADNRKARKAREFKRAGGIFGAVCRFLFSTETL